MILHVLAFPTVAVFRKALTHLWESSLVGLAVLGIIFACRHASAELRRTLGWVGLLKFAIPAAAFAPLIGGIEKLVRQLAPSSSGTLVTEIPGFRFLTLRTATHHLLPPVFADAMLGVWVIVSTVLIFRWVLNAIAFRREVVACAGPVSERLNHCLSTAAARVGLNPAPVAVASSESEGPGILGFISPLLVIPRALEANLTPGELESVLVHELIHLRRRDYLWGAIRTSFLTVFWHNPVVWLLCRSVSLETEKACDEEVIRLTGTPQAYANGILKTVRLSLGLLDASLTGAAGHSISSRITSILNPRPKADSPVMKMTALSAACLIAALSGYADKSPDATTSPKPDTPVGEVLDISKLDVMPKVLFQARPVYPVEMHAQAVSATVVVDFIVDTTGAVRNAYAVKSDQPAFAKSAVDAVSQWTFTAGQVAGQKVNTHMQVPIVYTIAAAAPKAKL